MLSSDECIHRQSTWTLLLSDHSISSWLWFWKIAGNMESCGEFSCTIQLIVTIHSLCSWKVLKCWSTYLKMSSKVEGLKFIFCSCFEVIFLQFSFVCRSYCSRRLRRIRKSLKFVYGNRNKYVSRKIKEETITDVRWVYFSTNILNVLFVVKCYMRWVEFGMHAGFYEPIQYNHINYQCRCVSILKGLFIWPSYALSDISNSIAYQWSVSICSSLRRFLYLPLMCAERCWAFMMQLKQESNTELRKRFHLMSRLIKAVRYAEELETLSQSQKCDARSKLEAQV